MKRKCLRVVNTLGVELELIECNPLNDCKSWIERYHIKPKYYMLKEIKLKIKNK